MFTNNLIEKRVNLIIKTRIKEAQAEYNTVSKNIDDRLQEDIEKMRQEAEFNKETVADRLIKSIVG